MEDIEHSANSFYGDDFPVNIPSADIAWNDMRKKLENDRKRRPYWWIFIFLIAGIVLLSVISVKTLNQQAGKNAGTIGNNSNPNNAAKPDRLNNSNTNDSLFSHQRSGEKYLNSVPTSDEEINIETASHKNLLSDSLSVNNFSPVNTLNPKSKQAGAASNFKKGSTTRRTKDFSVNRVESRVAAGTTLTAQASPSADSLYEERPSKDTIAGDIAAAKNGQRVTDSLKKDKVKAAKIQDDDAQENGDEEENEDDSTIKIVEAGLQWNIQLPFENAGSYFAGPGTQSQPYRILLPAAWINWHVDKSLLGVQINPFATMLTSEEPFKTMVSNWMVGDTAISETTTLTLNKLFGFTAGLAYDYNVKGDWWVGGNLQGNWWTSGIATSSIATSKKSLSNSFNPINSQANNQYTLNNIDWQNLSTFQMQLNLEILYRKKIWMTGFNAGFPITSISKTGNSLNYFYAALYFRLRLWTNDR